MQARKEQTCWQLFMNFISISPVKLSFFLLLMNQKIAAQNSVTLTFFSENFDAKKMENPCIHAYPGFQLEIEKGDEDDYTISQIRPSLGYHLINQMNAKKFLGTEFCNHQLRQRRNLDIIHSTNGDNSEYDIRFKRDDLLEIEIKPYKI